MKPINLKFCAPYRIIDRNGRNSLTLKKLVLILLATILKKERVKKNIKNVFIGYSD